MHDLSCSVYKVFKLPYKLTQVLPSVSTCQKRSLHDVQANALYSISEPSVLGFFNLIAFTSLYPVLYRRLLDQHATT